jgi:transposase InsO family protein
MGNLLHGSAKTTHRVRKEIQRSDKSIAALARQYYLNPKTVRYWKNAGTIFDKKSGPKTRVSVLNKLEQQAVCEVRRTLQLPLDDLFIVFKDSIPALTRSNLHRCLQHHGLSRLPKEEVSRDKKPFKEYPIGYMHVDITELLTDSGKEYLFVAIDRATKYIYIELHPHMTMDNAVQFLHNLQQDCVFKLTHILTDNGAQFTYKLLAKKLQPDRVHPFTALCNTLAIEHRTTQFRHPWTNGQVEITNKIIKEATTKKYHYADFDELKRHLMAFLLYYNYQRPLKSLKLKTPWELVQKWYDDVPDLFKSNPSHKMVGLNI